MKGYNSELQISKNLEKLAQSHGFIRTHAEHKSTDKAALDDDPSKGERNYAAIISVSKDGAYTDCGGDRKSSLPKVWTKKNPTFSWDYCACQNQDFKAILDHSRVGCSAEVGTDGSTSIFCYLNKKKCCHVQISSCNKDENFLAPSSSFYQCGITCKWDRNN